MMSIRRRCTYVPPAVDRQLLAQAKVVDAEGAPVTLREYGALDQGALKKPAVRLGLLDDLNGSVFDPKGHHTLPYLHVRSLRLLALFEVRLEGKGQAYVAHWSQTTCFPASFEGRASNAEDGALLEQGGAIDRLGLVVTHHTIISNLLEEFFLFAIFLFVCFISW